MFEYLEKNIKENSPYQAINFWAWGGEGRPRVPRSIYEAGDDLIGDPPHEYQGWYSVYNTDTTTHALIKDFNTLVYKYIYLEIMTPMYLYIKVNVSSTFFY